MENYGLTQEEVAKTVGKSRPAVANALRLLNLPQPVLLLLEQGKLSAGHARTLLGFPSQEEMIKAARIAVEKECGRMEWIVLDWNTPSIEFYKSLGAFPLDEWTVYRLTEEKMKALASADKK